MMRESCHLGRARRTAIVASGQRNAEYTGYLGKEYQEAGIKAYEGILNNFIDCSLYALRIGIIGNAINTKIEIKNATRPDTSYL